MSRSRLITICLLALISVSASAQNFPTKPLTLSAPFSLATGPGQYLKAFAQIASKYLGQSVTVEFSSDSHWTQGLEAIARTSQSDGYALCALSIAAFREPHLRKVGWDPRKDFTYIIGIAGLTFGVVVRSESQFNSLKDLIDYAKANPRKLRYGTIGHNSTPYFAMEELGLKTGALFVHVPSAGMKALFDGRIMAASASTVWAPYVDAGTFRLLVTFGERVSRWNVPTTMGLGIDVVSYSPIGIVGPKGVDPKVTKLLHDAFEHVLDDPDYDQLLRRFDMVDWYKSSEDYAEWAVDQFRFQRELVRRINSLGN